MTNKYKTPPGFVPLLITQQRKRAKTIEFINLRFADTPHEMFVKLGWPRARWVRNDRAVYVSDGELEQIREFITAIDDRQIRLQLGKRQRARAAAQRDRESRLLEWRRRRERELGLEVRARYPRPHRHEED
jgi:hypothetical protein